MTDGKCPKCGSDEIYTDAIVSLRIVDTGANEVVSGGGLFDVTPIQCANYACARCGYMERYVSSSADHKRIQQYWLKVSQD
jgi:predicted nucleic-acid-binding Zn-ribbon protein